ncbi:MAG: membrane protein [Alphaproteobacteria bacterium]|nr:MAG: membrane protein [Alphaproteobacteria bacterium]
MEPRQSARFVAVTPASLAAFIAAMTAVVAASNYLVQFPFDHFGLKDLLTWGAFTYPVAFLVNDLANRRHGPRGARLTVYAGFVLAVVLSAWLATPRIAIASGTAFLCAQLLDTQLFDRLRQRAWWQAPLVSSLIGSVLDTVLFFGIAFSATFAFVDRLTGGADGSLAFAVPFVGGEVPLWVSLAVGDFAVKVLTGLAMLVPYGALMGWLAPRAPAAA